MSNQTLMELVNQNTYSNGHQSRKRGYSGSVSIPTRSRVAHCKRKFLRVFPEGFRDETYLKWERGYKWRAHHEWQTVLNRKAYQAKLSQGKFLEIGSEAIRIESRTNLLPDEAEKRPSAQPSEPESPLHRS